MRGRRRYFLGLWLARWGFASLVAGAIALGIAMALTVTPPTDVPAVALGAASVYRVEVGGALFLGLYVAAMAFALALQNRRFAEIGGRGVRVQDLTAGTEVSASEEAALELVSDLVKEMDELDLRIEKEGS